MSKEEVPSGITPVDLLLKFLEDKKVESKKDAFDQTLMTLKYLWSCNLQEKTPETLNDFLSTNVFNAQTRRASLDLQQHSNLGKHPDTPIIVGVDIACPDQFYMTVFEWNYPQDKNAKDVPSFYDLLPKLSGVDRVGEEKLLPYLLRLKQFNKAEVSQQPLDDGSTMTTFQVDIVGMPGYHASGFHKGIVIDGRNGTLSMALDITVPYSDLGAWLQSDES
jgi:hypothetical protein